MGEGPLRDSVHFKQYSDLRLPRCVSGGVAEDMRLRLLDVSWGKHIGKLFPISSVEVPRGNPITRIPIT